MVKTGQGNTCPFLLIQSITQMRKLLFMLALVAATTLYAATGGPCKAITKSGKPCGGKAGANGYCFVHNPDAARCGAYKPNGTQCKLLVKKPGDHCRHHK